MRYQAFLTRKYLFASFIPWASVVAVAFAVFAIFVCLTVMEGFKVQMRDRIRGTLSYLRVHGNSGYGLYREKDLLKIIEEQPYVKAAAPFVETMALYRTGSSLEVCHVRGIDPLREAKLGGFADFLLRDHEYNELIMTRSNEQIDHVPLNDEEIAHLFSLERRRAIARSYGLTGFDLENPPQPMVVGLPAVRSGRLRPGQVVQLSSYSGVHFTPEQQKFLVVGVFRSGLTEHEGSTVYVPIRAAQNFLDLFDEREEVFDFRLSGVAIELHDYTEAPGILPALMDVMGQIPIPGLYITSWEERRANLLRAVDTEKSIIYVLMMLIVLFACFVIMVVLWLLMNQKRRDLGVLASLGAPPNGVVRVFTYLGLFLTISGATLGGLAGWAFTANINEIHDWIYRMTDWRLFDPNIYYITSIPVVYTMRDMMIIFIPTMYFGLKGSLLPAIVASRKDPVKSLRNE